MNRSSSSEPLHFELVDIDEARKALDLGPDGRPLPASRGLPGTAGAPSPVTTKPATAPAPASHAPKPEQLPEETVRWIVGLPAACRPLHLFKHYPKIGNRLALLWNDAEATQQYLDGLLVDHRGGRQGFPKEVFDDLMRLQHLLLKQRQGA